MIPGIRLDKNPVLACGTEEDPAALSSIFRRWTCYTVFSWSGASAVGTRLLHLDVTPGLAMLAGATGTGVTDNVRFFSAAGYVGLPFQWWRGDMEIMVEPFGTPFHRGTLQLAWVPFGSSWSAGDPTSAALNIIFDIEVGQRKVMRIPFARMEPFLQNLIYDMNVGVLPSGAANGTFFINVVNPL